jgi:hypothetical protein
MTSSQLAAACTIFFSPDFIPIPSMFLLTSLNSPSPIQFAKWPLSLLDHPFHMSTSSLTAMFSLFVFWWHQRHCACMWRVRHPRRRGCNSFTVSSHHKMTVSQWRYHSDRSLLGRAFSPQLAQWPRVYQWRERERSKESSLDCDGTDRDQQCVYAFRTSSTHCKDPAVSVRKSQDCGNTQ